MRPRLLSLMFCLLALLAAPQAAALTSTQAGRIAAGDSDDRVKALNEVVAEADTALEPFVRALLDDTVKTVGGKAFIVKDGKAVDAATGQPAGRCRRRCQQQPHAA